ncbi:hypothetical protein E2562_018208 [Oryza meyeriana var. granulata]|uniref:Uncharacterized protein n=1 Tax=Oryza meyeriana var. granulata TaxID=110450 RepID=A0A6G1CGQ0_9ORYZ|nr:hypothetical protein E2562_018208 [Oryza meyeriana var. granulata]
MLPRNEEITTTEITPPFPRRPLCGSQRSDSPVAASASDSLLPSSYCDGCYVGGGLRGLGGAQPSMSL